MAQPLGPEGYLSPLVLLLDPVQGGNEIHRLPQRPVPDVALIQCLQRLVQHQQGLRPAVGLLADALLRLAHRRQPVQGQPADDGLLVGKQVVERLDAHPGAGGDGIGVEGRKPLLLQQGQGGLLDAARHLLAAQLPGLAPHAQFGRQHVL
ncbi:hypothetical protein D3C77_308880 [compost metagenome]